MGAAILDLTHTSCRQGGFWREDIVFCWCLQWKSYFVDLFDNKVDRNRHMTYIARSWDGKNAINSFLRKLLAGKKSAFRKHVWSSAHRLSILAYRYDIEIIDFTVNRSTPYRWHPYHLLSNSHNMHHEADVLSSALSRKIEVWPAPCWIMIYL